MQSPSGCLTCCINCHTGVHSCRLYSVLRTESTVIVYCSVHTGHPPPRTPTRYATLPLEYCRQFRYSVVLDRTCSMEWGHTDLGFA